jgi:large subunit ribosomal protein L21
MRYAIVESGGKQYRVVEGGTLDVDRLPHEAGKKFELDRILLMADGDDILVGTPMVGGIQVKATVLSHIKGPKVISFKYRPKKRIRVKGGHRHQYTRLMVDFIGKPGEERKVEKPAAKKEVSEEKAPKKTPKREGANLARGPKEAAAKSATKKTAATKKSAPANKAATKKTIKK